MRSDGAIDIEEQPASGNIQRAAINFLIFTCLNALIASFLIDNFIEYSPCQSRCGVSKVLQDLLSELSLDVLKNDTLLLFDSFFQSCGRNYNHPFINLWTYPEFVDTGLSSILEG